MVTVNQQGRTLNVKGGAVQTYVNVVTIQVLITWTTTSSVWKEINFVLNLTLRMENVHHVSRNTP